MIKQSGSWLPSTQNTRDKGVYVHGTDYAKENGVWKAVNVPDNSPAVVFELRSTSSASALVTSKNLQAATASVRLYEINGAVRTLKKTSDLASNAVSANMGTLEANKTYQLEFDVCVGLDAADYYQTYLQFAQNAYVRKILSFNRTKFKINRYPIPFSSVLTEVPNYLPPFCKSLNSVFYGCTIFNQNISPWDTKNVVVWDYMFYQATTFNQNISGLSTVSATQWNGFALQATNFLAANKPAKFR